MPRVVDLSHPIYAGLVTYPGLPVPVITPHLTREDSRAKYAPGTEFAMDVITMIGNTGTYLDDTECGGERPAHSLLLGAGIHVVEHLTNLASLPEHGARFTAAPPAVKGFGTFPVRAFAEIPR